MHIGIRSVLIVAVLCSLLLLFVPHSIAVKPEDFHTCAQSGFCTRQRAYAELADRSAHDFRAAWRATSNVHVAQDRSEASFDLESTIFPNKQYVATITALERGTVHLLIEEKTPDRPRFRLADAPVPLLNNTLRTTTFSEHTSLSAQDVALTLDSGHVLHIIREPHFQIYLEKDGVIFYQFNSLGYLHYESSKMNRPDTEVNEDGDQDVLSDDVNEIERYKRDLYKSMDRETFRSFTDSKPHGPESIGFDVVFPGTSTAFGLAEHGTSAYLRSTRNSSRFPASEPQWGDDPYRLYNVDIFEYLADSSMALYGAVPYIMAHAGKHSAGIFWTNAADMWVDVQLFEDQDPSKEAVHTHWMAETGALDMLLYVGDHPKVVSDLYAASTQSTVMPPMFSIGYHQCRWNYVDEDDVLGVNKGFNEHNIPYDVIWLDIEYTNGKRYFTWDESKFPNPVGMQEHLTDDGRKLVLIIDPHIKKDNDYVISKDLVSKNLGIRDKDGNLYEGWCWPGASNWMDYLNPAAREYWASRFLLENFKGTTLDTHIWNDMNEPSVFNGPDISVPKDALHVNNIEHREVHNIYGVLMHSATREGLLQRTKGRDRPFVLSRSFFAGTQGIGAIWTGDNAATWEYLRVSTKMLLSLGISGINFAGSDVGGFFGDPDGDLMVRWYQTGIYNPFFRAHAHIDAKRREPWLFGEPYTTYFRNTIRQRYRTLPYLYTLFAEAALKGTPIVRHMIYEFPLARELYHLEFQFMFGDALLAHPVVNEGQDTQRTLIPFDSQDSRWFVFGDAVEGKEFKEIVPNKKMSEAPFIFEYEVSTPMWYSPVYLRGGHIVIEATRDRRSATLALYDPLRLVIALDGQGRSSGKLYRDDGTTVGSTGVWVSYSFSDGELRAVSTVTPACKAIDSRVANIVIEEVVLVGLETRPGQATLITGDGVSTDASVRGVRRRHSEGKDSDAAARSTAVRVKLGKNARLGVSWTLRLE